MTTQIELHERTDDEKDEYFFDKIQAGELKLIDFQIYMGMVRHDSRKRAANDVMNLANEYANQDPSMDGAEVIRNYHYFNAINKVGEFEGR